jgi:hypothetical protein
MPKCTCSQTRPSCHRRTPYRPYPAAGRNEKPGLLVSSDSALGSVSPSCQLRPRSESLSPPHAHHTIPSRVQLPIPRRRVGVVLTAMIGAQQHLDAAEHDGRAGSVIAATFHHANHSEILVADRHRVDNPGIGAGAGSGRGNGSGSGKGCGGGNGDGDGGSSGLGIGGTVVIATSLTSGPLSYTPRISALLKELRPPAALEATTFALARSRRDCPAGRAWPRLAGGLGAACDGSSASGISPTEGLRG